MERIRAVVEESGQAVELRTTAAMANLAGIQGTGGRICGPSSR